MFLVQNLGSLTNMGVASPSYTSHKQHGRSTDLSMGTGPTSSSATPVRCDMSGKGCLAS